MLLAIQARRRSETPPWKRGVVVKEEVRVSGSPILRRGSGVTQEEWVWGIGFGVPDVPDVWKICESACVGSAGSAGHPSTVSCEPLFAKETAGSRSADDPSMSFSADTARLA